MDTMDPPLLAAAVAVLVFFGVGVVFRDVLFGHTVHRTIFVDGRAADVLWYLADFANTADWDPNVRDARARTPRSRGSRPVAGDTFELTTLFQGQASKMEYVLTDVRLAASGAGLVELTGESAMAVARDTIVLHDVTARPTGQPRTRVDYRLELQLKSFRRPFIGLIGSALEQLGDESLGGLVRACARRFGRDTMNARATATVRPDMPHERPAKSPSRRSGGRK
jgi:hypothetical protein